MAREFFLSDVRFGAAQFTMESFVNPGGEDDPIIASCLRGEFDENESLAYWAYFAHLAGPGDILIDVGAYAGLYSLVAARFNPRVRMAAFEASTASYGRLVRNVLLNNVESRICAAPYAAWHETASLDFEHAAGIYSMSPGNSAVRTAAGTDYTEKVLAIPLDRLLDGPDDLPGVFGSRSLGLKSFSGIAAIKIDVEGAEEHVLQGARQILEKFRPNVICELLTRHAVSSVSSAMAGIGYAVKLVPTEQRNYLLVPYDRIDKLAQDFDAWKIAQKAEMVLSARRKLMIAIT